VSNLLNQARYDHLVRRVGAIIGGGSKVSEALSELFPVLSVEDLPAELLLLADWRMAMGGVELLAVAAETPKAQLFNPVDSGQLITVDRIDATCSNVTEMRYTLTATALGTDVGNEQFRDTRLGVANTPTGSIRSESAVGGIAANFTVRRIANTPTIFEDSKGVIVLGPGTGITVAPDTTNAILVVGFFWRERVAEESELNF